MDPSTRPAVFCLALLGAATPSRARAAAPDPRYQAIGAFLSGVPVDDAPGADPRVRALIAEIRAVQDGTSGADGEKTQLLGEIARLAQEADPARPAMPPPAVVRCYQDHVRGQALACGAVVQGEAPAQAPLLRERQRALVTAAAARYAASLNGSLADAVSASRLPGAVDPSRAPAAASRPLPPPVLGERPLDRGGPPPAAPVLSAPSPGSWPVFYAPDGDLLSGAERYAHDFFALWREGSAEPLARAEASMGAACAGSSGPSCWKATAAYASGVVVDGTLAVPDELTSLRPDVREKAMVGMTPLAVKDDVPDAIKAAKDGRYGAFALMAGLSAADLTGPLKGFFRGAVKKAFRRGEERALERGAAREAADWDAKAELARGDERLKEMKYVTDFVEARDTSRMTLSGPQQKTFARSIKALNDKKGFASWARGFKKEVLARMKRDGAPNDDAAFRRYFNALARERFEKAGFKLPPDGKVTVAGHEFEARDGFVDLDKPLSDADFQQVIAAGYVTTESHGAFFTGGITNFHGGMSHLVQHLYLADVNGAGYSDFYRRMGAPVAGRRTNPLWDTLGDGAARTLGSPSSVNYTVCEFFRFSPCPGAIQ